MQRPPGGHIFQATGTIFKLVQDIIGINLLTMFHDDRTMNVASRELIRFYSSNIAILGKNAPSPGGHVFNTTETIFELIQDIIWTNLLTKLHEDRKINVASRMLTMKNAPPNCGHVFQPTSIIFEIFQDIIEMNLLTKFHEDWTINVATIEKYPAPWRPCYSSKLLTSNITKNAPPPDIIWTNLLTKFHEDRKINVASRVFKRRPYIIGMNLLTRFHEDRTINVASSVKNAPPHWQPYIIKTNLLTNFHEDWTINVASRVLTRQMLTPHDARRTKGDHKSSP
ncbi:hypothetical protein DPMN_149685 [Dreissena polymorpha]|uniref:Uncharacterized protein n=1 Tax=Dreissena polymorpha TaxID=45954 RepID=A0A9D4FC27_DREPO|nr:hypothetical protein DPMN_149685 [Dreissena polymorpha]